MSYLQIKHKKYHVKKLQEKWKSCTLNTPNQTILYWNVLYKPVLVVKPTNITETMTASKNTVRLKLDDGVYVLQLKNKSDIIAVIQCAPCGMSDVEGDELECTCELLVSEKYFTRKVLDNGKTGRWVEYWISHFF